MQHLTRLVIKYLILQYVMLIYVTIVRVFNFIKFKKIKVLHFILEYYVISCKKDNM